MVHIPEIRGPTNRRGPNGKNSKTRLHHYKKRETC